MLPRSALLWLVLLASTAIADDVTLRGLERGKAYTVEVSAAGVVTLTPTKLVTVGGTPNPSPIPNPSPTLTPFEKEIQAQTKTVLVSEGGSETTGAALSEVYSRVSSGVADGSIDHKQALAAVKAATNLVLAEMPDKASWTGWRTAVGEALTKLQQEGALETKAQISSALKQVSNGLNAATGYTPQLQTAAKDGTGKGILGGIDIDKIIKLIELIMNLLKLFGL